MTTETNKEMPHFDGHTYSPDRDHHRLARQMREVSDILSDFEWHTLSDISSRTGHPEASVSARIRDLRKPKFGSHTIEREYVSRGLFRYRMVRVDMEESK